MRNGDMPRPGTAPQSQTETKGFTVASADAAPRSGELIEGPEFRHFSLSHSCELLRPFVSGGKTPKGCKCVESGGRILGGSSAGKPTFCPTRGSARLNPHIFPTLRLDLLAVIRAVGDFEDDSRIQPPVIEEFENGPLAIRLSNESGENPGIVYDRDAADLPQGEKCTGGETARRIPPGRSRPPGRGGSNPRCLSGPGRELPARWHGVILPSRGRRWRPGRRYSPP